MKKILLCGLMAVVLTACSDRDGDGVSAETSVEVDLKDERAALERNMEKAGREIEAGAKEAKQELKEAGQTIKEKFNEAKEEITDDDKAKVEVEVKKD